MGKGKGMGRKGGKMGTTRKPCPMGKKGGKKK